MASKENVERREDSLESDDMIAALPRCNRKIEDMEPERSVRLNIQHSEWSRGTPTKMVARWRECQTSPERPHLPH